MRSWVPAIFAAVMIAAGIASRLLDGRPGHVAMGLGVAALIGFLVSVLWRGGGPPGPGPGLRPPPTRFEGGTLP
jgi:hypothetical protein